VPDGSAVIHVNYSREADPVLLTDAEFAMLHVKTTIMICLRCCQSVDAAHRVSQ
jgi:hypothetical protein